MHPGDKNLITDVAGLKVGNAQDERLKSGTTVLTGDAPFTASVHVMGGAPGTRETDLLDPDKSVQAIDALVLSGGSAFGLDACSGVMDALHKAGRGFAIGNVTVPIVPGAILFDLINGGQKDWGTNPYRTLGETAYAKASENFGLGSVGAGAGALTAMFKGGLGSASLVLDNGATVGALVAANPLGSVTTPDSRHFWAAPFEMNKEFGGLGPSSASDLCGSFESKRIEAMMALTNTTIAVVATDADLSKAQCKRVATTAHDGIARAVVPAHTPSDGDLVFALSTSAVAVPDDAVAEIGTASAYCLSRAIARAIYEATPAENDLLPCWREAM